jgi:hypothetical protein
MGYNFPDEETLVRYLALLSKVLILARHNAYESDKKMAQLLDAIHNVPDLLCRWQDMNEAYVLADLEAYEAKYCGNGHPFSEILRHGVNSDWQLVWKDKDKNTKGEGA